MVRLTVVLTKIDDEKFFLSFSRDSNSVCANYNISIRDVGIWNSLSFDSPFFISRFRLFPSFLSLRITKKTHFSIFRSLEENDIITFSAIGSMVLKDTSLYAERTSEDYENKTQEIQTKVGKSISLTFVNKKSCACT